MLKSIRFNQKLNSNESLTNMLCEDLWNRMWINWKLPRNSYFILNIFRWNIKNSFFFPTKTEYCINLRYPRDTISLKWKSGSIVQPISQPMCIFPQSTSYHKLFRNVTLYVKNFSETSQTPNREIAESRSFLSQSFYPFRFNIVYE